MELKHLREWIGRSDLRTDHIQPGPAIALAATLDHDTGPSRDGDELPPLWHWLYFLPVHRRSAVGPDGHPQRGGFLPPIVQPRRMWAGSSLEFKHPLRFGDSITRNSRIVDINAKQGRSGELVFVKLRHQVSNQLGLAVVEQQDIVYRDHPRSGEPMPPPVAAPDEATWSDEIRTDAVLLFRYSALTFNGHRIHYDRPYATDVEGYRGLVVHGPLIATLLLDRLHHHLPGATIAAFTFRALRPVIEGTPFFACGRIDPQDTHSVRLWARDAGGALCMDASARLK